MKAPTFLLLSEASLVLAMVLVFAALHGNVSFNFGWPLEQFSFKMMGEAHGGAVALASLLLLVSAASLVGGLAGLLKSSRA